MKTLMKSLIAASVTVIVALDPANAQDQQRSVPSDAFSGAFFEINTGWAGNHMSNPQVNDTINYTVRFTSFDSRSNATDTGTRSSGFSVGGSGSGKSGQRITLGYGVTTGSFNLTPSLFYIPNSFSVGGGITLKNIWGVQLQPGFHIPLNKKNVRGLLLYGTVGFASTEVTQSVNASQSAMLCTPEIRRSDLFLGSGNSVVYYPSNCNNPEAAPFPAASQTSRSRLNGLVLGVGAKLAFSERIYGVFDFTYMLYGKPKDIELHQAKQVNGNGNYGRVVEDGGLVLKDYSGAWSRDYNVSGRRIRQSFISIGVGFRFF